MYEFNTQAVFKHCFHTENNVYDRRGVYNAILLFIYFN